MAGLGRGGTRSGEGGGGGELLGNIAAQIGGRHVRVTSILASPAADPRLYESDVTDALAVAEAGLVIENGAGYDTAPFQAPTVLICCRAADGGGRRSLALAAPARLAVALTG